MWGAFTFSTPRLSLSLSLSLSLPLTGASLYAPLPPSLSLFLLCHAAGNPTLSSFSCSLLLLFPPLFASVRLPLIHYPSLTTLFCRCEVDPTLGRASLLTVPLHLSIYPPSFLLLSPSHSLTKGYRETCHSEKTPSLSSSIKRTSLFHCVLSCFSHSCLLSSPCLLHLPSLRPLLCYSLAHNEVQLFSSSATSAFKTALTPLSPPCKLSIQPP